jgi:flagellar biosynthesis anti-sigma factor FlgM
MTVRIDNSQSLPLDAAAPTQSNSATSANGSAKLSDSNALNGSTDTASISSLTSQMAGDAPIRQDRVEALRAQIESGTYTVDSRAVATAMFQNLFRS